MYFAKSRITVELEDIGPVLFERSLRAQHININVKPQSGVRVAVPKGISFQTAINFAKFNTSWIQRRQKRMKELLEKNDYFGLKKDQVLVVTGSHFLVSKILSKLS